jgi:hypothetical protein
MWWASQKFGRRRGNTRGQKSRGHRERLERNADNHSLGRSAQLEEELRRLQDGDALFWASKDGSANLRESNLEDNLAFERVESGTSLFDGLQHQEIDLPHPEKLDEEGRSRDVSHSMPGSEIFNILEEAVKTSFSAIVNLSSPSPPHFSLVEVLSESTQ